MPAALDSDLQNTGTGNSRTLPLYNNEFVIRHLEIHRAPVLSMNLNRFSSQSIHVFPQTLFCNLTLQPLIYLTRASDFINKGQ